MHGWPGAQDVPPVGYKVPGEFAADGAIERDEEMGGTGLIRAA